MRDFRGFDDLLWGLWGPGLAPFDLEWELQQYFARGNYTRGAWYAQIASGGCHM